MTAFAAPVVIDGPTRTQPDYGLFSVLDFSGPDRHWQAGLEWEAISCEPASGRGADCEDVLGPTIFVRHGDLAEATPFTVYGSYTCTPTGRSMPQAESYARAHLAAREEYAVERAISSGNLNNSPDFGGATTLGTGATNPALALGLLEQHLADAYGSQGVIHVPRLGIPALCRDGLVVQSGSVLETCQGTPVVAGGGYENTSPDGTDASAAEAWAYATPAMFGARSEVVTHEALDRATNDLEIIASRTYAVGWDPCDVGAVLIDLS